MYNRTDTTGILTLTLWHLSYQDQCMLREIKCQNGGLWRYSGVCVFFLFLGLKSFRSSEIILIVKSNHNDDFFVSMGELEKKRIRYKVIVSWLTIK